MIPGDFITLGFLRDLGHVFKKRLRYRSFWTSGSAVVGYMGAGGFIFP